MTSQRRPVSSHLAPFTVGIFFFFLMEFLQGLQYFVIDDCDNIWNKALVLACRPLVRKARLNPLSQTVLGFLHICCQPYFTHVINSSLTRSEKTLHQYKIVLKVCHNTPQDLASLTNRRCRAVVGFGRSDAVWKVPHLTLGSRRLRAADRG